MVDCYVGTSSNEMIQRLIILQHFSSSFSLLLFVHSSRSTPSRLSLFHMVVVACFMFLHLSLVSSHHAYQSITLFTTLLIVCANDTCGGGWLLCIRIALLTVFPSLSHSGYRYLFDARTAALLVPADDRATASTSNKMMHVIVWMVGWPDITTLQRLSDIYHYILLLVLRPAGDISGRIVLSALQSMCITLNVGSLLSTLRNVSRLLSILHPTPPTAYYLLLSWLRPLVVGSSFMV